jgi:hypothetical protein
MLGALLVLKRQMETRMVKIRITKPFRLTNRDGTISEYAPGDHDFPDGSEDHFFIRAHSDKAEGAAPGLGSAAHVEKMRSVAEARRKAVQEADDLVREAEEAHMSAEEQKARAAARDAGLTLPKPAGAIQGGPAVEGAVREISPGMKGLPDRDAAVGGLEEPGERASGEEASLTDDDAFGGGPNDPDVNDDDDTDGSDPALLAAKKEAREAQRNKTASDTTTNTSAPVRRKAIVDPTT